MPVGKSVFVRDREREKVGEKEEERKLGGGRV